MDLPTLERAIEACSPDEQDHLAARLTALRLQRDPHHAAELDRRLDDKTGWVSWKDAKDQMN